MSSSRRQHAPWFATGLPAWAFYGLRTAGVMLEEWTSQQWRVESSRDRTLNALLLFDSRMPASRSAAETAADRGFTTLNLAPLIHASVQAARSYDEDSDALPFVAAGTRELPARLQQEVAARGFFWARIADYPYPYQAALCGAAGSIDATEQSESEAGETANLFAPDNLGELASASEVALEDLQSRYASGHAMYIPPQLSAESSQMIARCLRGGSFPLLWKTTPEMFHDWRDFRKRVRLNILSEETTLQIHCEIRGDGYQPALELWRSRHFAALPLSPGSQTLDERSLIFQSAARRHQAGLAALSANAASTHRSPIAVTHAL